VKHGEGGGNLILDQLFGKRRGVRTTKKKPRGKGEKPGQRATLGGSHVNRDSTDGVEKKGGKEVRESEGRTTAKNLSLGLRRLRVAPSEHEKRNQKKT